MRDRSIAALLALTVLLATGCSSLRTRYHMAAGNKLYLGQKYEEAIAEYKKIVSYDPTNWTASYQIAMSYLAMYHPGSNHPKDVEYANEAGTAFETLLKLKAPDQDTADKIRNYYIALLTSANKTDKVIAYYTELLNKDPGNGMLISQLAQVYAKNGDFQNALKWFEKRTEAEPKNKEAWYYVGYVCWERSNKGGQLVSDAERQEILPKGMKALDQALQIDPDYFEAVVYMKLLWMEQAKLLQSEDKLVEANEAWAKAKELEARHIAIYKQRLAAKQPAGATPSSN